MSSLSNMDAQPFIRPGISQDVPLILQFIRDAAEEQAPGSIVGATEESLTRTLHLDAPTNETESNGIPQRFAWPLLIYSPNGQPAGLLIYFYNFSTWSAAPGLCLEELYVLPEYRRHGYAKLLLKAMAVEAQKAGCIKMDWVCLSNNEKALKFYRKLGAKTMESWQVLKMNQEGIKELASS